MVSLLGVQEFPGIFVFLSEIAAEMAMRRYREKTNLTCVGVRFEEEEEEIGQSSQVFRCDFSGVINLRRIYRFLE